MVYENSSGFCTFSPAVHQQKEGSREISGGHYRLHSSSPNLSYSICFGIALFGTSSNRAAHRRVCSKRPSWQHRLLVGGDAIFHDPAIDVVIVSTPPMSHFELVSEAKILTVYQNRRWDDDYSVLQKFLTEHRLGRVVEFKSHFD